MTDPKLPKYRIIEKAKTFAAGQEKAESKKLGTLMQSIHADPEYWLWVNEVLFDSFTWASEAMAARLNKGEVLSLRKHLEANDLFLVRFNDSKAYQAIILEALASSIASLKKLLNARLRKIEEETACVLKFTIDGPIASGYPHGVPVTAYFTSKGIMFMVYIDRAGANKVFASSFDLPLSEDHIAHRVVSAIEHHSKLFDETCAIHVSLKDSETRLDNLKKFGMTVLQ